MKKETSHDEAFDYPNLNTMSARDFYKTYTGFMYSVALKKCSDHGLADMAVNDVMMTIYVKHGCHFNPQKGRFSNYLATMVRNACRTLMRKDSKYVNIEEEALVHLCDENHATAGLASCEANEIRQWVDEGIRRLRKEIRSQLMVDAFVMALINEERPMDIAKKLNVRPAYVSLAKNRCLPRLRAILMKIKRAEDGAF